MLNLYLIPLILKAGRPQRKSFRVILSASALWKRGVRCSACALRLRTGSDAHSLGRRTGESPGINGGEAEITDPVDSSSSRCECGSLSQHGSWLKRTKQRLNRRGLCFPEARPQRLVLPRLLSPVQARLSLLVTPSNWVIITGSVRLWQRCGTFSHLH